MIREIVRTETRRDKMRIKKKSAKNNICFHHHFLNLISIIEAFGNN